jgi:hypothetical protein
MILTWKKVRDAFLITESITNAAGSSGHGFCITKNVYP